MKPYDKITIIRNRYRARDLRLFRELVQTYFERSERLDFAERVMAQQQPMKRLNAPSDRDVQTPV